MITVWKLSGCQLASLSSDDINNVRSLKEHLGDLCGKPRFRQRILHNGEILDDMHELVPPIDVLLVILDYTPSRDQGLYLLRACLVGDESDVERLLQRPEDPNAGWIRVGPMRAAAVLGKWDIVHLLIEARADASCDLHPEFNSHTEAWQDPVILAGGRGQVETVRQLLQAGEGDQVSRSLKGSRLKKLRRLMHPKDYALVSGDVDWHSRLRSHVKSAKACCLLSGCLLILSILTGNRLVCFALLSSIGLVGVSLLKCQMCSKKMQY
ncbi:ANK1 [Symbiodinium pilosum]|uniref:ANK1 protein n=1 Tax=Symbiodinium pilosum TaxID=2952 RepID=A0A812TYG0_SYMPI|nr:ANK1 [Symbiodinium pilosum]